MRLAESIRQTDPRFDAGTGGIYSSVARAIEEAQRFELSFEVLEAAIGVSMARPSSMLTALPLAKLPYRKCWFEWLGKVLRPGFRPATTDEAPVPERMGALVEVDETFHRGTVTYAWRHKQGTSICPISHFFDFTPGAPLIEDLLKLSKHPRDFDVDTIRSHLIRKGFGTSGQLAEEELQACLTIDRMIVALPGVHAGKFMGLVKDKGGQQEVDRAYLVSLKDIDGEFSPIIALTILMNTKNALQSNREDLSKLNRARAKQKRSQLLEFIKTDFRLSRVQGNRFNASGLDRAAARKHLVRGHFKIRKGGVFWWSPFVRGSSDGGTVQRISYNVRT